MGGGRGTRRVTAFAGWSTKAEQVLKKNCEIGVGFSFAALSVFRLRRAEAASAVWIPHWHSEPFESQRGAGGEAVDGSFLCSLITDFLAEGAGWGASPGRGGELGGQAQQVLKKL